MFLVSLKVQRPMYAGQDAVHTCNSQDAACLFSVLNVCLAPGNCVSGSGWSLRSPCASFGFQSHVTVSLILCLFVPLPQKDQLFHGIRFPSATSRSLRSHLLHACNTCLDFPEVVSFEFGIRSMLHFFWSRYKVGSLYSSRYLQFFSLCCLPVITSGPARHPVFLLRTDRTLPLQTTLNFFLGRSLFSFCFIQSH